MDFDKLPLKLKKSQKHIKYKQIRKNHMSKKVFELIFT